VAEQATASVTSADGAHWALLANAATELRAASIGADAESVWVAGTFDCDDVLELGGLYTRRDLKIPCRVGTYGNDLFVAELGPAGRARLITSFGSTGSDQLSALSLHGERLGLAMTSSDGPLDIGGGSTGLVDGDAFVAVLGSCAERTWARGYGTASAASDSSTGVRRVVDARFSAQGDLLTTGEFGPSIDLGGGRVEGHGFGFSEVDTFVASYASDGRLNWGRTWGNEQRQQVHAVIPDLATASGEAVVLGISTEPVALVGQNEGLAAAHALAVELDTAGDVVWAWSADGRPWLLAGEYAADGSLFLAGAFDLPITLDGVVIDPGAVGDGLLLSFDAARKLTRRWVFAAAGPVSVDQVHLLANGDVALLVTFAGALTLDGTPLVADDGSGNPTSALLRLTSSGQFVAAEVFGPIESPKAELLHGGDLLLSGKLLARARFEFGTLDPSPEGS